MPDSVGLPARSQFSQRSSDTPRARWLDNLFNHLEIRQWEQGDITAHVYGAIGVVTSTYHWAGTMHEQAFDAAA